MRRLLRSPSTLTGLVVLVLLVAIAVLAPLLAPYDPNLQALDIRLAPASATHWLGTDGFGRDLLSRLIYGARPTLVLVTLVMALTVPVGLIVGVLAGFHGGWIEAALMRFTDTVMAFPVLVMALAFIAVLGPGLINGAIALALTAWPAYARLVRAEIAVLRRSDYLAAAEMLGITGPRLLIGHVLPLALPAVLVRAALDMGAMILNIAGLGFLGLGIQPPTAEWGTMVAEGGAVIFDQWWIAAAPGAAILVACLGFNLLGEGLRDVLDPRHA